MPTPPKALRSFASSDRFVAEVTNAAAGKSQLKAGYVLLGDEAFLYDRCRRAVIDAFVDPSMRSSRRSTARAPHR
jgi:DNA polymerase-3 subunit delta